MSDFKNPAASAPKNQCPFFFLFMILWVFVVNDLTDQITGKVIIDFISWQDGSTLDSWSYSYVIDALSSGLVVNTVLSKMISGSGQRNSGFFNLKFIDTSGTSLSENLFYLSSFTDVTLNQPNINFINATQQNSEVISFTVVSDQVSPLTYFQSDIYSGAFSDNGVMLLPNVEKTISFHSKTPISSASNFLGSLYARAIKNTYSS